VWEKNTVPATIVYEGIIPAEQADY